MKLIRSACEMQAICETFRYNKYELNQPTVIKLVPTMGALHKGHGSLMELAKLGRVKPDNQGWTSRAFDSSIIVEQRDEEQEAARSIVVVSIFINPAQFNDPSDFEKYPSSLDADLNLCRLFGVDYVFAPDCKDIYPNGSHPGSICMIEPPDYLGNTLEATSRPGHFRGMLTIVNKLLNIVKPHEIYLGEKDYQQMILVSRMITDLNMEVKVCAGETVREPDFLPLSSRNVRLGPLERKLAPLIYTILVDAKRALESNVINRKLLRGEVDLASIIQASLLATKIAHLDQKDEAATGFRVDYLDVRCAKDLSEIKCNSEKSQLDCSFGCVGNDCYIKRTFNCRLLASVIVGGVRLLDNIEVTLVTNLPVGIIKT